MTDNHELSAGDLIAVAAIIFGFGVAALTFRIQRETEMPDKGLPSWLPWADRLIITSIVLVAGLV